MTQLDIVIEDARWENLPLTRIADTATRAALAATGAREGYEIVLMACDDARIAALRRTRDALTELAEACGGRHTSRAS